MNIHAEKIKELIEILDAANLTEIEVKNGEQSIRLSRHALQTQTTVSTATPAMEQTTNHITPVETGHKISSPMVGIFYQAPSPKAKPFVEIGQPVKKGQVLCIIEAMKMMNQIEADRSGTLRACLVENAQPVEFGQALFIIE